MQMMPHASADVERCVKQWLELADKHEDSVLGAWMKNALNNIEAKKLLTNVFGHSPYLSRLLMLYPDVARQMMTAGPDDAHARLNQSFAAEGDLMHNLRVAKGKLALLVALADIGGLWTLEQVTGALSDFAQAALELTLQHLLLAAHKRGEIILPHADSAQDSGIIILGMGKLGGRELNYSSDIDLIIFFEQGRLSYNGRLSEQHFMNKLAHDIVEIMQERTADGYVFRTDLRLRPDPASTPPAVTTEAAYYYYESVGQNWERAAMIKARPVAGDMQAAERFLERLRPFMWRRNLDFASINDIHSIKRQMDTKHSRDIQLKGHNIKLGVGGIREIEFYAQIHQLIWGGREPSLRTRGTCETLERLVSFGLIDAATEKTLKTAYAFFRKLEHRLQMVADEQTHSLPETDAGIAMIASFMGCESVEAFAEELFAHLHAVHGIYSSSFKGADKLGDEGNLVFTGVSDDPETIKTLRAMGYEHPETVSEIVMGWHHGSRRATRTKRARELLTEMMPTLLKRLAETAHPDTAFLKFNEFLTNLPAGVQLFSLFNANPHMLGLIADILGSAPTLAEHLSKSPSLLDAVLYADFYDALPSPQYIAGQLKGILSTANDFEERMDMLRQYRNEKQFQAGVQLLRNMISSIQAGKFLSDLADLMITESYNAVMAEFSKTYGTIKGGRFVILALGKLGSREMTFSSDIDLVFLYDAPDFDAVSDGKKSFSVSVYYNRFAQRLLHSLSGLGRDGRLYEVDTRLRPSGEQGLLAVSVKTLEHYFEELAWTFEYMAFTKARVVMGDEDMTEQLEGFIRRQLAKPRDMEKLRIDAIDMRTRIEKSHGTRNPWNMKYVRGGLVDIDFIAQYLMLRHAPDTLGAKPGAAHELIAWLEQTHRIDHEFAANLKAADRFLGEIFNRLRLCSDHDFDEALALPGLKKLLCDAVGEKDFGALKSRLIEVERSVLEYYNTAFTP